METARHFVGVRIKFATRVKRRHDDFSCRFAFFFMKINRNTTTIVPDCDAIVGVNHYIHACAVPGKRFVDRVVNELLHHVLQTCAILGITDVHPRPTPHSVKSMQDFDAIRGVIVVVCDFCHPVIHRGASCTEFFKSSIWCQALRGLDPSRCFT